MIVLMQMDQFMLNQVVDPFGWQQNYAPMKKELSFFGAISRSATTKIFFMNPESFRHARNDKIPSGPAIVPKWPRRMDQCSKKIRKENRRYNR